MAYVAVPFRVLATDIVVPVFFVLHGLIGF